MSDRAMLSRRALKAGLLSIGAGFVILGVKFAAWFLTGSSALFADATESIVNVVAATMATWSVVVAARPADDDHPYGHGKAEALSAAAEGVMIGVAAMVIVVESVRNIVAGPELEQLGVGIAVATFAGLANLVLGLVLLRVGREEDSEALRADGHHLITDVVTTGGAVVGLIAVKLTGIALLDPIVALLVGANILRTGWRVVRGALTGLLDEADFDLLERIAKHLESVRQPEWIEIHELRARSSGSSRHVDLHLSVPRYVPLQRAHMAGDDVERELLAFAGPQGSAVVHLDPCLPRQCPGCVVEDCPVRSAPLIKRAAFDSESMTKPGRL